MVKRLKIELLGLVLVIVRLHMQVESLEVKCLKQKPKEKFDT